MQQPGRNPYARFRGKTEGGKTEGGKTEGQSLLRIGDAASCALIGPTIAVTYRVVVNDDGQLSIWPEGRQAPDGWRFGSAAGSKAHCLDAIESLARHPRPAVEPLASRGGTTVHGLVEEQATRHPDEVALVAGEQRLTYAELDQAANQLAHYLARRGAGPGARVALCSERGTDLVVGVLAVLKCGAACVPLDPEYPPARLAFMLADCDASVVLARSRLYDRPADGRDGGPGDGADGRLADGRDGGLGDGRDGGLEAPAVAHLDWTWAEIDRESRQPPACAVGPQDLAYLMYTSGSTGRPKGVAMPHACLVNLLRWQALDSSAGPGTRTLHYASIGFDVAFQELFSTWSTGGTLVLANEDQRRDFPALWRLIVDQGVQRVFLPPAALHQLARAASGAADLEEVITAGEALRIDAGLRAFFARLPGCRLVNQYGPTETHVVTAYHLDGDPAGWPTLPPIGTAIAHTETHVLEETLEPVAAGTEGELYLGGLSVGLGYLGQPALTAEKFLPDPYGPSGGRLYRTGDVVRRLNDGNLEFLGRADRQVKLRGFRIEPGEIEAVLEGHPDVGSAVVMLRHDLPSGTGLVAYIEAPAHAPALPPDEAAGWLASRLPSHMVPTAIVAVDSIPVTRNGKVDYQALPVPRPAGPGEKAGPMTPMEAAVAQCFAQLLGLPAVGVDDSFFALGGHSLLATQLTSRLRERFAVEIPLRQVFDNDTVAALAIVIAQAQTR